jgi:hypothetical protein
MRTIRCLILSVIALVAVPAGPAPGAAEPGDRHPDLKRLSPTEDVWVDPGQKEVVVGGLIAIDRGPIEFFACPEGTKEHESIVATRARVARSITCSSPLGSFFEMLESTATST